MNGQASNQNQLGSVRSAKVRTGIKRGKLTQGRVRELFEYQDGNLIRRTSQGRRGKGGDVAGSLNSDGYMDTGVDGKLYRNHRLIWLWHYGYFPEHGLDHIDRDKLNNRIENLREASPSCNQRNTETRANNTSGVKGVSWCKRARKWRARIKINGEDIHLGYHDDPTEAVAHRLAAEQCLDWEGCDRNSPAFVFMRNYCAGVQIGTLADGVSPHHARP